MEMKSIFRVYRAGEWHIVGYSPGDTILEAIRRAGIYVTSPCGGNGTCGKCIIRVSDKECLACVTLAQDNNGQEVHITPEGNLEAIVGLSMYENICDIECDRECDGVINRYGIAIDIGTTTLAFQLLDMETGCVTTSLSSGNSQRAFGADVITRIAAATRGKLALLNQYILEDIKKGIGRLLAQGGVESGQIAFVALAGNTTMLHLLQNFSCDTLGVYPFAPVSLDMTRVDFDEFFGLEGFNCPMIILPCVSAFVGADVLAGVLHCGWGSNNICPEPNLLIDLGTNGEMVLFSHEQVLTASTAAGPVFEGGNISMGMGSQPGAIAQVSYSPENCVFSYKTLDNMPPVGICGTGVVDIAAELVRYGLADCSGQMSAESVAIAPGITFTQRDFREVQLAKSAIRSGIEILLEEAGMGYDMVGKVFLAGGFGYKISAANAAVLGIIPPKLKNKVRALGNTALGGVAQVMLSRAREADIQELAAIAKEILLSGHPRFNTLFMTHMSMEME